MNIKNCVHKTDVIILCGGLGTRLKDKLFDKPKVLAPFGNKTFLDFLIEYLYIQGFQRFILCVGYKKELIKNHRFSINSNLFFSEENYPLGTGGALINALPLFKSDPFLVVNGDSFCRVSYSDLYKFHTQKKSLLTMVTSRSTRNDGGSIKINSSQRIISFNEKEDSATPYINSGIYLMQKEVINLMPKKKNFSLEYDIFPKLSKENCYSFCSESDLIDIGTPERYLLAKEIYEKAQNL